MYEPDQDKNKIRGRTILVAYRFWYELLTVECNNVSIVIDQFANSKFCKQNYLTIQNGISFY